MLENVSYGKIAGQPSRILESPGFKQALADLGLTEELVTSSLVEDIKAKPKMRLGELRLAAEMLKMTKVAEEPQKPQVSNTYNFLFSPETQAEVKEIEDKIKARLLQKHDTQTD